MAWSSKEKAREYMREYYKKNKHIVRQKHREWRVRNRDRHLSLAREYHWANRDEILRKKREHTRKPEQRAKRADKLRKVKYGITAEQYERMLAEQNGLCAICHSAPANVVDHNHATGVVRAILCSPCNTGMGLFQENPERLKAAIEYLERMAAEA